MVVGSDHEFVVQFQGDRVCKRMNSDEKALILKEDRSGTKVNRLLKPSFSPPRHLGLTISCNVSLNSSVSTRQI